jgi:hypothetical protein
LQEADTAAHLDHENAQQTLEHGRIPPLGNPGQAHQHRQVEHDFGLSAGSKLRREALAVSSIFCCSP